MFYGGATVVATTRFPVDSALRFSKEPDLWIGFENSRIRLATHSECGDFCNFIEQKIQAIGYLINNAAQTVRRPAGFYTHLMENEERSIASLPQQAGIITGSYELSG
jgi:hypothetical protein